jgi:MoaA/NifB/PqqE/SkfB family radical SAM enzyme
LNPFVGNKLLRFPEKIAEWMKFGTTSGPLVVDFDLTNKCPHNCPKCPGEWRSDPDAEVSFDEAVDWLKQFRDLGAKAVSFGGGGDPMAHTYAVNIIEAAHSMGLSVGVITNGAILPREDARRLCKLCSWIRFSIDACEPESFASIHGVSPKHFNTVIGNVKYITQLPQRKAVIGAAFLTDATTDIDGCAELASTLGVDYVQFRPFNFDMADVREQIASAKQKYETESFKVLASMPKYELMGKDYTKPYDFCHFVHFGTVCTAKGELHTCCDMRCESGCFGSLREKSLAELWVSDARRRVASAIDTGKCPPLCRANASNILLDSISRPITHEEFL